MKFLDRFKGTVREEEVPPVLGRKPQTAPEIINAIYTARAKAAEATSEQVVPPSNFSVRAFMELGQVEQHLQVCEDQGTAITLPPRDRTLICGERTWHTPRPPLDFDKE